MTRSITGLVELPSAGLLRPEEMLKLHTPTLVLNVSSPVAGFRSPAPLSLMLMSGFTPSNIVKVAAAFAQFAIPTTASPTIKFLRPIFISALFSLLTDFPFLTHTRLNPLCGCNNRQKSEFFLRDIPTPPKCLPDGGRIRIAPRAWMSCANRQAGEGSLDGRWKSPPGISAMAWRFRGLNDSDRLSRIRISRPH